MKIISGTDLLNFGKAMASLEAVMAWAEAESRICEIQQGAVVPEYSPTVQSQGTSIA